MGGALLRQTTILYPNANIHAFSRYQIDIPKICSYIIDYEDENSLYLGAKKETEKSPLDMVIIATGMLHDGANIMPEKSLKDLSMDKFAHIFKVNTAIPAMIAKYFVPQMVKNDRAILAAISARIGSISDNHLGVVVCLSGIKGSS